MMITVVKKALEGGQTLSSLRLQAEDEGGFLSTRDIQAPKLRADAAPQAARDGDVAFNSFYGSIPRGYQPGSALADGDAGGAARAGEPRAALRRGAEAGASRGSGGPRGASAARVRASHASQLHRECLIADGPASTSSTGVLRNGACAVHLRRGRSRPRWALGY